MAKVKRVEQRRLSCNLPLLLPHSVQASSLWSFVSRKRSLPAFYLAIFASASSPLFWLRSSFHTWYQCRHPLVGDVWIHSPSQVLVEGCRVSSPLFVPSHFSDSPNRPETPDEHLKQPRRNSDRYHYCYGNLYRCAGSPDRQDAPEPLKQNHKDLDRDHYCYRNLCRADSPDRHKEPEHLKQIRRNSDR